MSCDTGGAGLLVMGGNRPVIYGITDAAGGVVPLTGKSVSAVAQYGTAGATLSPTSSISNAAGGEVTVTFSSGNLTTITVGQNVTLNISVFNADGTLFDRLQDSLVTVY